MKAAQPSALSNPRAVIPLLGIGLGLGLGGVAYARRARKRLEAALTGTRSQFLPLFVAALGGSLDGYSMRRGKHGETEPKAPKARRSVRKRPGAVALSEQVSGHDVLDRLSFREVTRERWPDFERLFESPGGPKYCWCMAWRATPEETRRTDSASRKAMMRKRIADGVPVGILAYLGRDPVAWCSIAPRETYRRLGGPEEPSDAGKVWSLACFFVQRRLRGQGIARRLIQAAVDHARARGASVVEAYPVAPDSPSYRFMGFIAPFEAAGFRLVGTAGTRRHVMRLDVR